MRYEHELKVVPPYFDSLVAGTKTFEVRRNDRAYQRGDVLRLGEWHPQSMVHLGNCEVAGCYEGNYSGDGHWAGCRETVYRRVTFVYSGDPRFGGVEPGFVVLGLGPIDNGTRIPLADVLAEFDVAASEQGAPE